MVIKLTPGLVLADKLSSREERCYFFPNILKKKCCLVCSQTTGVYRLLFFFFGYKTSLSLKEDVLTSLYVFVH